MDMTSVALVHPGDRGDVTADIGHIEGFISRSSQVMATNRTDYANLCDFQRRELQQV